MNKASQQLPSQPSQLSTRELDQIVGGRVATNPPTSIDI
jgi:hypothetical protein